MGHRVSTMAGEEPAVSGAAPPLGSSALARRAFLITVLVAVAASSPSSQAAASSPSAYARASPASAAATCCFVTADRPPVTKGQKIRRRPRSEAADVVPTPPPSGGSCPYTGQLVPPSSSQLRFQSGRDVGAELTVPPSLSLATRRRNNKKEKKGSWFKFSTKRGSSTLADIDEDEYERRKLEWAAKYTDVSTLRRSFGSNRNKLWGDFDPETTRKLYHTLLPRALMALNDLGVMTEQELAPLAYEARCAAKKYARERCVVPGRFMAMAYDGFRSWRDHGKWNAEGMTWDQVWDKYERQISDELDDDADADELTRQICLRILERSCKTNPKVDKICLGDEDDGKDQGKLKLSKADVIKRKKQADIASISAKLERDVHELLFEGARESILFDEEPARDQRRKDLLRALRRTKRERRRNRRALSSPQESSDKPEVSITILADDDHDEELDDDHHHLSAKDVAILRMIAEAKKKVIAVLRSDNLVHVQLRKEMLKHLRHEQAQAKAESAQKDSRHDDEELQIFTSELAVPPRQSRANHHDRKKVWQRRSENDALPRRWRRRGVVHPEERAE